MGIGNDAARRRRAGRLSLLAAACLTVLLAFSAGSASAAYTASVTNQTLTVTGDGASDKLALSLDPSDPTQLQGDVGEDGSPDFTFPLSAFTSIQVSAGAGNDQVDINELSGSFTDKALTIDGGPGNDQITGGSGADTLIGGIGNDTIVGRRGNDVAMMGDGNDTFAWNPGDGSDTVEGQAGTDVLAFNGANVNENIALSANASRVRLTRDVANIVMDLNEVEQVKLATLGGADNVAAHDLTGTNLKIINVDLGSPPGSGTGDGAADTVTADGTAGNDTANFGPITGGTSVTGLFARVNVTGADAGDRFGVQGLGASDTVNSPILPGPVTTTFDGGDGSDSANYNGTANADTINAVRDAAGTGVFTAVSGAAPLDTTAVETLTLNGSGGGDSLSGGNGLGTLTQLRLNGGDGNDTLVGGDGGDILKAGNGDDTVMGGRGNDVAFLGDGNDTFTWNPGDGSDTVEGQTGADLVQFDGANVNENIALSPNGNRVRLTRDVAAITMDMHGVERAQVAALGGADQVTVNDLSGTDMHSVAVDLGSPPGGGGDGAADTVTVNGTGHTDTLSVVPAGNNVLVFGLFAPVQIAGSEVGNDSLAINTVGGTDSVAVDPGVSQLINPVVNLGPQ